MAESKEKADFIPKIFTTKSNHKRRKNKNSKDSIVKSQLLSIEKKLGISGLYDGKVYHLSFDCPKPLAKLFKEATKHKDSSICRELRNFMVGYVQNYVLEKTAFGNTLSKILNPNVTVNSTNIQYIQSRPRRLIRDCEPEFLTDDGLQTCEIGSCHNEAVEVGVYVETKRKYRMCKLHYENNLNNPKVWRFPK